MIRKWFQALNIYTFCIKIWLIRISLGQFLTLDPSSLRFLEIWQGFSCWILWLQPSMPSFNFLQQSINKLIVDRNCVNKSIYYSFRSMYLFVCKIRRWATKNQWNIVFRVRHTILELDINFVEFYLY